MNDITLVMITKNEERCLARCLSSFRAYIDKIVVLDTGSTDNTVHIARSFGALVDFWNWTDDFSAAKNRALSLASTTFKIVIDADEWLIQGGELFFSTSCFDIRNVYRIKRKNYFNLENDIQIMEEWITRIVPPGVMFEGAIHEQFVHNKPTKKIDIIIGHDGFLPENRLEKRNRNLNILKKLVSEKPTDGYYLYQIGKEYENIRKFKIASKYYLKAINHSSFDIAYRHDLIVRAIYTLAKAKRFHESLQLIEGREWENTADFHFAAGGALLDYAVETKSQSVQVLEKIEYHWKKCLEIGENSALNGTVNGRGSFLAAKNLFHFYQCFGLHEEANKYIKFFRK